MQEYLPQGNWSMAAILGLDDNTIEEVCKKVTSGFVVPANYNCQGQVAISGEKQAVEEAMDLLKQAGAKRAIELKTSGPFHTEKLKESAEAFRKELDDVRIHKFESKVVKNIDGELYTNQDDVKDILFRHIISPVKFSKCLKTMMCMGIDNFVEVGPGKVLRRVPAK